jgi:hypothetical protein
MMVDGSMKVQQKATVQSHSEARGKLWQRPPSRIPALALSGTELCDLLSRELNAANMLLDEWDRLKSGRRVAQQQ